MQVDLGLTELDAQSAAQAFDDGLASKLRDYLRNECILDIAGTNRVMELLKRIYINGVRMLQAQFYFSPAELRIDHPEQEPSQEIIEASQQMSQAIGKQISENLVNAQLAILYSAASHLAMQDEKVFKRPRH